MTELPGVITVTAPADAPSIAIFRMVAASVVARTETSIDVVDDVRIAVGEACNHLLTSSTEARTLFMDVALESATLRVSVAVDPAAGDMDPGSVGSDLSWTIIRGLTDEATASVIGGRSTITMVIGIATNQR